MVNEAPSLDVCKGCGERVTDFDPNGFEGEDAQRGHFTCGQRPSDRLTITSLTDYASDALTQIHDAVRSTAGVSPELITEFTRASIALIARLNEGE